MTQAEETQKKRELVASFVSKITNEKFVSRAGERVVEKMKQHLEINLQSLRLALRLEGARCPRCEGPDQPFWDDVAKAVRCPGCAVG